MGASSSCKTLTKWLCSTFEPKRNKYSSLLISVIISVKDLSSKEIYILICYNIQDYIDVQEKNNPLIIFHPKLIKLRNNPIQSTRIILLLEDPIIY